MAKFGPELQRLDRGALIRRDMALPTHGLLLRRFLRKRTSASSLCRKLTLVWPLHSLCLCPADQGRANRCSCRVQRRSALLLAGTFFVSSLKGIGRIDLHAVLDTSGS